MIRRRLAGLSAAAVLALSGAAVSAPTAAAGGPACSGLKMPTSSSPGFRALGGTEFDTAASAGHVAARDDQPQNRTYSRWIMAYHDDWYGNWGGRWATQSNLSVSGGCLNAKVRTLGGEPTGAAWVWKYPGAKSAPYGFKYGAFEQRVRLVGDGSGYGVATLLWPDDATKTGSRYAGNGELDWPEAYLTPGHHPHGYVHEIGDRPQRNVAQASHRYLLTTWHTYRTEWRPGEVRYLIDGHVVLRYTKSDGVPRVPMHAVTQLQVDSTGKTPRASVSAELRVAWVRWEALR